ncbi:hypothetical protein [Actinoplanes sp. HUAS TT8]|uniref:hypothetical protein n=1 Tax=Actinoplanes sp. HUAS TT8 TaxID=3447453 RepID=UPI003F520DB6
MTFVQRKLDLTHGSTATGLKERHDDQGYELRLMIQLKSAGQPIGTSSIDACYLISMKPRTDDWSTG